MYQQQRPSTASPTVRQSQDKYDRFENWLRDNGAKFDRLELRSYPTPSMHGCSEEQEDEKKEPVYDTAVESEMRGVHAKYDVPANTCIMQIPRRCLITVEMGQATPIGQKIFHSDLDLDAPKHIYLMIYILLDRRNPHSFFQPYYDILPATLSNMPIFWSESELAELQGSHILHQIADRHQAIAHDYHSICAIAPELADICTLADFQWARMCVCSRNFGLCVDGHRTSALVPHADMLNHYRPRETKWTFDEQLQCFTITSLQNIGQGQEVLDSYGQKCNHRFLLNYGFAVEDNREIDGFCPNEVCLELSVAHTDPCSHSKLEFWLRGHEENLKRVRVCVSNNENTRLLFSWLRVLACDAEELRRVAAPSLNHYPRSSGDVRHPLSIRTEVQALKLLAAVCQRTKSRYPTTLLQDERDLANLEQFPMFSNKRHAKIQVHGEKQVLEHFENWSRVGLQVLDVLAAELRSSSLVNLQYSNFERFLRQLEDSDTHHTILRYCADVLGSLRREEIKQRRSRSYR